MGHKARLDISGIWGRTKVIKFTLFSSYDIGRLCQENHG